MISAQQANKSSGTLATTRDCGLNNLSGLAVTRSEIDLCDGKSAVEQATRSRQLTQWPVHAHASTLETPRITLKSANAEARDVQKAMTLAEQIKVEHLASCWARNLVRE